MAEGRRSGAAAAASLLRKDALMAQNLKLLGLDVSSSALPLAAGAGAGAGAVGGGRGHEPQQVAPSMFDRPNEKLLFRTLHFLLLRLKPAIAQELRYCWPITTPQDKSSFKKLVQTAKSVLAELEKQQQLPAGSSQASRINTGCGPRVVDLVWRLSTLALRAALERDFPAKKFTPLPNFEHVPTADALLAVKTRIAMKTETLKRKSVERCHVQDEWVACAATLTEKIHEVTSMQKQVQEEQNAFDASVDRSMFSLACEARRSTNVQNLETAWRVIDDTLKSPMYAKIQSVLGTAVQYSSEQPILAAGDIRANAAVPERSEPVNLSDVVKSTASFIDMVRSRVRVGDLDELSQNQTASVLENSNRQIAALRTMVLQLQQLVAQIKEANELDARDRYIQMAASEAGDMKPESRTPTRQVKLCPLTPAQIIQQESHLVRSLKKVSMRELTALAAESVRRSNQRKERGGHLSVGDAEGMAALNEVEEAVEVSRQLNYGDGDEDMEP